MAILPYWAWLATLVLVVAALRLLRVGRRPRRLRLPPGPRPWPVIGNLNLLSHLLHRSIHDLSRTYGPIMQLHFGSFPVVVASTAETAREFLKTHDAVLASRPKTGSGKYLGYGNTSMLWSSDGPYWRQARKIFRTELLSAARVESSEYVRAEETRSTMRRLLESKGGDIVLKPYFTDLSLSIISRMVLGRKYSDDAGAVISGEELRGLADEVSVLNVALNICDSIPWLEILDPQGYIRRMKAAAASFDRFLEHVLDEHESRMNATEGYVARDMVDVLLQQARDPNLEVKVDRRQVKAWTLDLIVGGMESSAMTMEWVMSELLKNPEILMRATEEVDSVTGGRRWLVDNDIPNLPYVEAVVKETMRLHPVSPLLPFGMAKEDCVIAGYDVPAGTWATVSTWSLGRDPAVWGDPLEFRPERFLGTDIYVKGQDFSFLPFGSGRRMCPGYALGYKVILTSMANLVLGFDWGLAGNLRREDLDMEEVFGISATRKTPLRVVARPRLPPAMYGA